VMTVYLVAPHRQPHQSLDAVDKVQDDRVVLEMGVLILAVEPDFARLNQQTHLLVLLDHLLVHVVLCLVHNEDDFLQVLQKVVFGEDFLHEQRYRLEVNIVGVGVIEQQK
jgi:hypothetical protein